MQFAHLPDITILQAGFRWPGNCSLNMDNRFGIANHAILDGRTQIERGYDSEIPLRLGPLRRHCPDLATGFTGQINRGALENDYATFHDRQVMTGLAISSTICVESSTVRLPPSSES